MDEKIDKKLLPATIVFTFLALVGIGAFFHFATTYPIIILIFLGIFIVIVIGFIIGLGIYCVLEERKRRKKQESE